MKSEKLVSVIIPAYNAEKTLAIVLDAFEKQTFDKREFEVIVVDDGSTKCQLFEQDLKRWTFNLYIIRQINRGRAAARNVGCTLATGKYIVFCDADRIPIPTFIDEFIHAMENREDLVCVGNPLDYFGGKEIRYNDEFLWEKLYRYSRESNYFSNISKIYDCDGNTVSGICWSSFLVGASCISKKKFFSVGGFDENFVEWGFEHYDLGLKLWDNGCQFRCLKNNYSFHIPHSRNKGFYKEKFESSQKILSSNHEKLNLESFYNYVEGKESLQNFEKAFTGTVTEQLSSSKPLYIKIVNF